MRRHEDARLGAVHAREPRALTGRDLSVRVQLGGGLAEVPDVPGLVLRVPVGGALLEPPAQVEPVRDGGADDARDPSRLARHVDDVA